jgi:membrane-bound metal-dependent hydrolase YbcI (DUF457 family)
LFVWSFVLLFQYQKKASIDTISSLFLALLLHIFLGAIHIQGYESIFLSNFSFESTRTTDWFTNQKGNKDGWCFMLGKVIDLHYYAQWASHYE